jgi:hypothetical protein
LQAVVPAEDGFIQIERQLVPKINRANLSSVRSTRVSTHVDLQALATTRCLRPSLFPQPCIVLQRPAQKNVVPRAQAEYGNLNLRVVIFDRCPSYWMLNGRSFLRDRERLSVTA